MVSVTWLAVAFIVAMVTETAYSTSAHKLCLSELCSVCNKDSAVCHTESVNEPIPQHDLEPNIKILNVTYKAGTDNATVELTHAMFFSLSLVKKIEFGRKLSLRSKRDIFFSH